MKAEPKTEENRVKNRGLWRKFFHLVRYARIPWIGILIYFIVNLSTVYVAVMLPQVDADIYSGDASVANIAFVIVVELASSLLSSIMTAAYGVIGGRIDRNFRNAIWHKILRLEPKFFDKVSPNTLLSRLTDDAESMKDFILLILSEITGITTTVATIAAMSTMNRELAVIMILYVPVNMVFGFLIGRLKMRFGNNVKFQLSQLTDYLSGQLARITVIQAFNRQQYETARGNDKIRDYYVAERQVLIGDFIRYAAGSTLGLCPSIALIVVGIYLLNTGSLTPAGWIVFYAYANQIVYFFSSKIDLWINIKEYQGRMNRLTELFSYPEESVQPYREESVPAGDLVFEDISFGYGEKPVLSHASLTFPQNECTAIVGPSGTGKTTILKLLERIYSPASGRILLNGQELKDYKLENWRRQISYVKQDTPLISGTIRENVLYGVEGTVSDAQIMAAAKELGADTLIQHCPGGLDYQVGQFGERLSGGQRQKLSLLRAFLQKREYLLLDEPTASLDVVSAQEVIQSIRRLMGKRTIILVAHDEKLIRDASHIVVVENASHIIEGTPEQVLAESHFFCQMAGGKVS